MATATWRSSRSSSPTTPPPPAPNRLVIGLLLDQSLDGPQALAAAYQSTFQRVLGDWLAHPGARPADAADRAAIVAWILEQTLLDPAGVKSAEAAFHNSLAASDEARRQIEAAVAPPRQALAIADGTAENELVFIRGNPKTLGDEVPRRFLEVLGGTEHAPPATGSGRLELARQMVSPACPLVPRVIVNRLWHHHFGAGMVRSPDDFGAMGQPPTHPELLDYLARELIREGWSLKQLHRHDGAVEHISNVEPRRSRGRRRRSAKQALASHGTSAGSRPKRFATPCCAISGRLEDTMYGPGVMPHLTDFMAGRGRPTDPARSTATAAAASTWRCAATSSRRCSWRSTIPRRSPRSAAAACRTCRPRP